jgi:hypothetical protein
MLGWVIGLDRLKINSVFDWTAIKNFRKQNGDSLRKHWRNRLIKKLFPVRFRSGGPRSRTIGDESGIDVVHSFTKDDKKNTKRRHSSVPDFNDTHGVFQSQFPLVPFFQQMITPRRPRSSRIAIRTQSNTKCCRQFSH